MATQLVTADSLVGLVATGLYPEYHPATRRASGNPSPVYARVPAQLN